MPPTELKSMEDLEAALAASRERPVILFKHSTRCPISHAANRNYLNFVEKNSGVDGLFTHLDLISHRDISEAIAERLGIRHESPQAILVKDGKAAWNASHLSITEEKLAEALKSLDS